MNFADVLIIDEDSEEWNLRVTTSMGRLVPAGRGGEFHTLIDKTKQKEYHFNWKPPESAVELIDATMEYARDHHKDWTSYKKDIKGDAIDFAGNAITGDMTLGMDNGKLKQFEEAMDDDDYKDQYETWETNINELKRDVNRMKTSTSVYEMFLRSISFGLEGLQIFYGTKGFVEGKLGDASEESGGREYLEGVRDRTIHYGVDSLQAGIRHWANLVREGSLDTISVPVHIIVEVTDDQGFMAREDAVFRYTYHMVE